MLAEFDGEPLVRRAARTALAAGLSPVVVVVGAYAQEVSAAIEGLPVQLAENPAWAAGQSTSVRAGITALPPTADGALVLLGDQPLVSSALIAGLVEFAAPDAIVAPQVAGRRGNPVLFGRSHFAELMSLTGDFGARRLLSEHPVITVEWDSADAFLDVDTPEDLRRIGALPEPEASAPEALDVASLRRDFPILARAMPSGGPLIYLDSAATSQKPVAVLEAMRRFNERGNANIHRGIHTLAEEATALYEGAREKVAAFIGAPSAREVVFTRNATESINLVARTWGCANVRRGDLIVLTEMEHHANIVPWQMLAHEKGARLAFVPVRDDGLLDLGAYRALLAEKPRLVAFTHLSNVLGTVTPAAEMIAMAHDAGATTLLDGSQSVPHMPVDVAALGADFLAFSGHKMLGPTGIGVLFGREELLEAMPPFLGGGDMISAVTFDSFEVAELPHKFEAGTPAIAEAIGLGAAVDYLSELGMERVAEHGRRLAEYACETLAAIEGLRILGPSAKHRGPLVAFTLDGVHPHDVAQLLDSEGIAVRAGHHCAMPLHERLGLGASTRASFHVYNQFSEVDALVDALARVRRLFLLESRSA